MKLTIRRDATVWSEEVHEPRAMPEPLDRGDDTAILTWLRSPVDLEEGVTGAVLFRALRPWSAVLSRMAWMDFDAWDEVVSRAHLRAVDAGAEADATDPNGIPNLVGVEIGPEMKVSHKQAGSVLSIAWRTHGISEDDKATYSLALAPPSSWIHLPVRINPFSVMDGKFLRAAGLSKATSSGYVKPLYVAPTFWEAIVKGFLDNVTSEGSPEEAKANRERIANTLAEMTEIEEMRPSFMPREGA